MLKYIFTSKTKIGFFILMSLIFSAAQAQQDSTKTNLFDMSLEQLMELKISSVSKKSETVQETPQTVIVLTREELRQRGYSDLEQVFHDLPGFDISRGYGTQYSQVYQRGYRSNNTEKTLLLIDGVESNDLWSQSVWLGQQYPLSNIKRIEIIYGPASTVYGANAFLGVVNVITIDGNKTDASPHKFGISAQNGYGSWSTKYADMTLRYAFNKAINIRLTGRYYYSDGSDISNYPDWDYKLSAYDLDYYKNKLGTDNDAVAQRAMDLDNKSYYDDAKLGGIKPVYSNQSNNYLIDAKIKFYNLTIGYQTFQRDDGYGAWYRDDYELGPTNGGKWVPNNRFLYAKYEKKVNDNWSITSFTRFKVHKIKETSKEFYYTGYMNGGYGLSGLVDSTGNLLAENEQKNPNWETYYYNTYSQQLRSTVRSNYHKGDFNLVSGVEVRYSLTQGNYRVSTVPHPEDNGTGGNLLGGNYFYNRDLGLFVQADYTYNKFKFVLGGRIDNNKIRERGGYGTVFNPKLAIIYSHDDFVFKAIYSEAFQDASFWTKYGTTPARLLNNPTLQPERLKNFDFAFNWKINSHLWLTSSAYYSSYDGVIGTADVSFVDDNGNTVQTTQHQSLGSLEILGAQANLRFKYGKYDAYFNYSFTKPYDVTQEKIRIGDIADHKANFGVNARYFDKLNINLRANYVGRKPTGKNTTISANPYDQIDAYFIFNGAITYDFYQGVALQVLMNNILDKEYFDPGVRSANGDYYAARLPQYRRNFMLKLLIDL